MLIGVLSILNLPISQYPDISPPTVNISTIYNGADAQTVEQTITTPIETQVNGTPGMAYMQSNSTSSGQSTITVTYNVGADVTSGALDVQNRVGIATPALPDDVKNLGSYEKTQPKYFNAGGHLFTKWNACSNFFR